MDPSSARHDVAGRGGALRASCQRRDEWRRFADLPDHPVARLDPASSDQLYRKSGAASSRRGRVVPAAASSSGPRFRRELPLSRQARNVLRRCSRLRDRTRQEFGESSCPPPLMPFAQLLEPSWTVAAQVSLTDSNKDKVWLLRIASAVLSVPLSSASRRTPCERGSCARSKSSVIVTTESLLTPNAAPCSPTLTVEALIRLPTRRIHTKLPRCQPEASWSHRR